MAKAVRNMRFIKSAVDAEGCPQDPVGKEMAEIALTGRSNTGKSSFINSLSGQKKLASVSNAPGKTRLINFFEVPTKYRIVDLPGYGFSRRGSEEEAEWGPMVENYLQARPQLVGVLIMLDLRRDWDEREQALKDFLFTYSLGAALVATKSDQIKPRELEKKVKSLSKDSGLPVFPISNKTYMGVDEVEKFLFQNWVKKLPELIRTF